MRQPHSRAVVTSRRGGLSILVDVSKHLLPDGDNTFTFRMADSDNRRMQCRGIVERPLVWSPKEK